MIRFVLILFVVVAILWFYKWYKVMRINHTHPIRELIQVIPSFKGSTETITKCIVDTFVLFLAAGPIGWIILLYVIFKYFIYLLILIAVSAWIKRSPSKQEKQ